MTVSLIISTYNWPRALYLCLDSVMQQTVMPSEILIADDGSGMSTRDVVKHFESISPVPVRHIWHEDNGFRLAAIRNKAIAAAHGEYVIQVDGDVILQRSFVLDHMVFAKKGYFAAGSRGIITEMLTQKVLSGEIASLYPLMRGIKNSNNTIRLPLMSYLFRAMQPEKPVRGCNMAFWRDDLIRVNGYDENIVGWGCEDNDIANRLRNAGVGKHMLKFRGIVFHLHHKLAERSHWEENRRIREQNLLERKIRCTLGIDQYPLAQSLPAISQTRIFPETTGPKTVWSASGR